MFTVEIQGTGPNVFTGGQLLVSQLAQPVTLTQLDVSAGFQPSAGGSGAGVEAFGGTVTLQIAP